MNASERRASLLRTVVPCDQIVLEPEEYAEIGRKVAKETKSTPCDLRKAFQVFIGKNNADDKAQGILTTDRVHLNDAGNKLVAETILNAIDK